MNPICLFDGHCDTVYRGSLPAEDPHRSRGDLASNSGHLDLNRLQRAYGRSCQFFALFGYPADFPGKAAEEVFRLEYGWFARQMEIHSGRAAHCRTGEEARQALSQGKTAAFLSVEGAELLDCDPARLEEAHRLGVRAVNLTWNYANPLSGSNAEEPGRGLTARGRAFVAEMQRLGMLVDVSHLSDPGFWDVAELAERAGIPFFASHSNARAVCPHKRNLTDEQITAIIKVQGTVGLNLCASFVGEPPTLDALIAHVEHIWALGGADSLAVGGDWDGCDLAAGLTGVDGLTALYEELLRRNHSETLVRALFFENLMRVVSEVCTM